MKDNIFLDSNIFLYGFSDTDLKKHEIAKDILLSDNFTAYSGHIGHVSRKFLDTKNEL